MSPADGSQDQASDTNVAIAADDRRDPRLKRILRKFLPKRLIAERGIMARLGPKAGRIYLALRLFDGIPMGAPNARIVPPGARNFLFVCFGNIMRSPMAERMMKHALPEYIKDATVASAGIHATPGSPAHPRAQVAAHHFQLPLEDHRSRLLTAQMMDEADAVFAMDFQNKAELLALFPEAKNKIYMLAAYASRSERCREIPDPYFGDQEYTQNCYAAIQQCIANLAASQWPTALAGSRRSLLNQQVNVLSSPTGTPRQ